MRAIGLGDRFLGHVERCRVLAASHRRHRRGRRRGLQDGARRACEAYGQGLVDKPEIVVLNKADALSADDIKNKSRSLKRAAKKRRW
jgi:GTP-binding protein